MKIGLIGPGIISIPPVGWGAVEILIWDYYNELKKLGHDVHIINHIRSNESDQSTSDTAYSQLLIQTINDLELDFVHLHYDCLYHILEFLNAKNIAITSHYPYIDKLDKHKSDNYMYIFNYLIRQNKFYNIVITDKDYDMFLKYGANRSRIFKLKNGVKSDDFKFLTKPLLDKTIYLGNISSRKNQSRYQSIQNIDFVGSCADYRFNTSASNYLGNWSRDQVHNNMTNYCNLILISSGEADPLVVKEALVAGLGIVINESAAANLMSKNFISIIPDDKIDNLPYIKHVIDENKEISKNIRDEIRAYGIEQFDISVVCKSYIELISTLSINYVLIH